MERTLNRVEIKGNVGGEPKIVQLDGGGTLIRFSLATHETFKTKDGVLKEETTWHNIVAWSSRSMPDFNEINKGAFVEVVGKLKYSRYVNKQGEERNLTEIVAQKMVLPQTNN